MSLPRLNAAVVAELHELVPQPRAQELTRLPERVLQFGEGVFLRGFVDWMIDRMNRAGVFNGRVVVVQPLAQGTVEQLNKQNGFYTLLLGGVRNAEVIESRQIIGSISRGINPVSRLPRVPAMCGEPRLTVHRLQYH